MALHRASGEGGCPPIDDETGVQAIHLTINGMVAKSLGIGTGTVQHISGERAMSLRGAEQ